MYRTKNGITVLNEVTCFQRLCNVQPFAKQKDRLMSNFDFKGNNSTEMQTTPGQTPIQLTRMRTVTGLSGQTIRELRGGHTVDIRRVISID